MTTDESQPAPAQPDGGEKPAGRTGEGSQSIVAALALAHQQQRVDELVNEAGPPDLEADSGDDEP